MGFRMLLIFLVVLAVTGTYGEQTIDDIWGSDEEIEYTTSATSQCIVSGRPGVCVEIANCKTKHYGEERITYRTTRKCKTGVCCVQSDVVDTTTYTPTSGSTSGTSVTTSVPTTMGTNPNPPQVGCGIRNENGQFFRGAADTKHTRFGEFPWTVAIYKVVNRQEKYSAVGSLIHPRVVLTMASKFDRGGNFKIRAGDWNLPNVQERLIHEERDVESMVIHEEFNSGSGANDIGLLFLNKDVLQNFHISYACLPDSDQVNEPSTTCLMTGWGQVTVDGPIQDTQKFVELPLVDRDICQTKIREGLRNPRYNLDASMICAGGNGQDACKGDGGAPLVCPYPGQTVRYYQAGIVSWGVACQVRDLPGVYSDVTHLRKWVDEKIIARGYTTNYYTP